MQEFVGESTGYVHGSDPAILNAMLSDRDRRGNGSSPCDCGLVLMEDECLFLPACMCVR